MEIHICYKQACSCAKQPLKFNMHDAAQPLICMIQHLTCARQPHASCGTEFTSFMLQLIENFMPQVYSRHPQGKVSDILKIHM